MTTDNQIQGKPIRKFTTSQWLQRVGRWGARFILLLLFTGSGFLHYQSYRQGLRQQSLLVVTEAHLATHQQRCQQQAQQSVDQQKRLRCVLEQHTERLLQAQQTSAQQAQELLQLRQQLLRLSASRRADWQLLEVQSLLKAAGHQLWLLHNVAAARQLLQGATDLLTTDNHPALLPLRQALADDSRQLAVIDLPDPEGLVLQLLNDLAQVDRLPFARQPQVTLDGLLPTPPLVESAGWIQRLLHQGQRLLPQLITIQRQSDRDLTVTVPSESGSRERLSAYLRLAVQAVLQQQSVPYQHCLSRMITILQAQFEQQDSSVQALLSGLQQRQQQSLQPELPQQLRSQRVLESFLQQGFGDARLLSPHAGMVQ
jgi:uroporphyrin-III C-methyltransferase